MKNKTWILLFIVFFGFTKFFIYSSNYSRSTPKKNYRENTILIHVAGDENHPPYEYTDNSGNYKGFNVDIMNALSIELGLDIEFIPMNWSEALKALEKKEVDLIQGMSNTEERQKRFLFTTPTVINSQSIFVMKDTSIVSSIEDLAGLRVAFQTGDINHEIIKNIPEVIMLPKKNQEEAIDSLLNGEADAYVGNKLTGLFYLQKNKKTSFVKTVGDQMATSEYGPATYMGNEELANLLSEGIKTLKENGTYHKIYEKWFGKEIVDDASIIREYLEEIIIFIIIIVVALILFMIWNKKLKQEVERRTLELENANKELILRQQKIHNLAYYDSVTLLPNRLYLIEILNEHISMAKDQHSQFAVLNFDLDRFKQINDTLGHHTGDEVLKLVGERIGKFIDKDHFFARIGGDEFIILIKDIKADREHIHMASKIIKEFSKPFEVAGHRLFLTTSIGISIYPYGGDTMSDLIKNSDIAMYVAKGNGGDSYYIYDKSLSEKQMENLMIVNQLRQAIDHSEFVLLYQPIMSASTGTVVGMEALIRWNKPGEGIIGPDKFIPIAEEVGLIIPIGNWVIRTACIQVKDWLFRGYDVKRVYINISGRQFQQKDFFESVIQILNEVGLEPKYIGIEITETVVIQDINHTIELIKKLKDIGIRVSIDDFGTGYSNFNYLKEMRVDGLKIDRSFIRETNTDCKKRAIARTIILLAHQLDITVTAEGVETKEQLEFLRESKCSNIQGYYYSKPVSAEVFENFLDYKIKSINN